MKLKNARKRPSSVDAFQRNLREATSSLPGKPIQLNHGKLMVVRTHTRDLIEADEDGHSAVAASMTFREGYYFFPKVYFHPEKKIVGETKDARFKKDRGWEIYLDAVLRDKTGHPVLFEGGQEIDVSGWYRESELKDAGLGMEMIKPGQTLPSISEIEENRAARIRRSAKHG